MLMMHFRIEREEIMYKILGYYICEKIIAPNWIGIKSNEMITVSGCFSGILPDLEYCYFINNRKKERSEYLKKWNINKEKAIMLQKEMQDMFQKRLAMDGRFSELADAKKIYENYFNERKCVIVSVSTTEEYYKIAMEELGEQSNVVNDFYSGSSDENELLGYDILGWDRDSGLYHTFLCNHLHKDLESLKFNKYCLIENNFEMVQNFAKNIQGKGEPVKWIPCRIGKCE